MISASFAIVLYAFASKGENNDALVRKTVQYAKICGTISLLCVLALVFIPTHIYSLVFGPDFGTVHRAIGALSVAMVCTSVSTIINHYFAGLGMYMTNAKAAFWGSAVSVIGNLVLVPHLGFVGAGIIASLANLVVVIYLVRLFMRHTQVKIAEFLPSRCDLDVLRAQFVKLLPDKR